MKAAVKNYVDETVKSYGRIDGFYNNAGIEGRQALIPDLERGTNVDCLPSILCFEVRGGLL